MFLQINVTHSRRRTTCLSVSIGLHCVFLAWLLHSASPTFVAPSSIMGGERGSQITHLYWQGAAAQSVEEPRQERLTLTPARNRKKQSPPVPAKFAVENGIAEARETEPGKPAGSPYGSLSEGTLTGYEVRPALPFVTPDPIVNSGDLPANAEGNVIIEITIDEQGNVVEAFVEQGLGPVVDAKVLTAVRDWRFRPATKNGIAIASKQDVYYHFPRH
jgi:protein TonB